jgi:hypothetical protein
MAQKISLMGSTALLLEGPARRTFGRSLPVDWISYSISALHELQIPPGNQLEKLGGDRKGQNSIRINDQYRICFFWTK